MINGLAHTGSPWNADGEEVLDAEMVHAVAPGAAITIVLITPSAFHSAKSGVASAGAALRLGARAGAVISISAAGQTGGEHCDTRSEVKALNSALVDAAHQRVTVIAASGDIGAVGEPCDLAKGLLGGNFPTVKEANLPASDPLVLAAGGTTLTASHTTGRYIGETGWGLPYGMAGTQFQASGGGFSHLFARPSYQSALSAAGTGRGVPDIASDAAPHTGMALVSRTGGGRYTIRNSGGTSAAAPLWAGVIALADQYAHRHLGFVNAAIYQIAQTSHDAFHQVTAQTSHDAFHQVTTANNSVSFPPHTIIGYHAGRGWNPVTGWGSPNASVLVPLLARYSRPRAQSPPRITERRRARDSGRGARAMTNAGLYREDVAGLANRQIRASVLAGSRLAVGSTQKSQVKPPRFCCHATPVVVAAEPPPGTLLLQVLDAQKQ